MLRRMEGAPRSFGVGPAAGARGEVVEGKPRTRSPLRTYVVREREISGGRCALVIEGCAGERERLVVRGVVPDRWGAAELYRAGLRPMAVKLEATDSGCSATCLARSEAGPIRVAVSQATALALCLEGRHTVVVRQDGVTGWPGASARGR